MSKSKLKKARPQRSKQSQASHGENQGEGNKDAARHYNSAATKFAHDDQVEPAAKRAEQFVDEHPVEAAKAEAEGIAGPHPVKKRVEELIQEGKAIVSSVVDKVRDIAGGSKKSER